MAFKASDIAAHVPKLGKFGGATVEGLTVVEENLLKLMNRMAEAGYFATQKAADRVLLGAQKVVPYKTGDLFGTGKRVQTKDAQGRFARIHNSGSFYVTFGDAEIDYALLVHENPEGVAFKQPPESPSPYPDPKTSHYLQWPAEIEAGQFLSKVKEEVEPAVAEVIREVGTVAQPRSMTPRLIKKK
jgi:hypothetical protein